MWDNKRTYLNFNLSFRYEDVRKENRCLQFSLYRQFSFTVDEVTQQCQNPISQETSTWFLFENSTVSSLLIKNHLLSLIAAIRSLRQVGNKVHWNLREPLWTFVLPWKQNPGTVTNKATRNNLHPLWSLNSFSEICA